MAYTPTTWVQGVTPVGPTNLNKLEAGLVAAAAVADAAIPKPASPANSDVLYYDLATTSWKNKKITAAEIAAGAAIAKSQLAALGIVDADVAVGAGINPAKLAAGLLGSQINFSVGASPPGGAVTGDLWLCTVDSGNGIYWLFRYDSAQATYKWIAVGAPAPLSSEVLTSEATATTASYVDLATVGPSVVLPRAGDYEIEYGSRISSNTAADGGKVSIYLNTAPSNNEDIQAISAAINHGFSPARKIVRQGLASGATIKHQYAAITGGSASFQYRWLTVRPIRVS